MYRWLYRNRSAFTLIEMLIVIVVVAILALIVIPRVMSAQRRSQESVLKDNIRELRSAITRFYSDTGVFPTTLNDLLVTSSPTNGINEAGMEISIPPGTYAGPYMTPSGGLTKSPGIPVNPFCDTGVNGEITDHWAYPVTDAPGKVVSAVTGRVTLDGADFEKL